MKKVLLVAVMIGAFSFGAKAQSLFGEIIKAQQADAEEILKGYLSPHLKGFSAGLNSGWYNTAQVHMPPTPDLSLSFNVVFVPASDKTFDLSSLPLQSIGYSAPSTPTIAGSKDDAVSQITVYAPDPMNGGTPKAVLSPTFAMPPGTGISMLPLPTAQLSIGLPFSTDIIVRYVPTLSTGDASIGLVGFGLKHSIKQYIPGVSSLPFDWSLLIGYTSFKATYKLNVQSGGSSFNDQEMALKSNNYTVATIISKKVLNFTFYGGIGYDMSTTDLQMNGTYPVTRSFDSSTGQPVTVNVSNPLNLSINTSNGAKINAGIRFKFLKVLGLNLDYTLAKYSLISVGFGVGIGN